MTSELIWDDDVTPEGLSETFTLYDSLGATRNPGDWAFSAVWSRVETDSVMSFFSYSDFGRDGGTNAQGPFLKIAYMLFPRLTLTTKNHFVSFIDRPRGQSNSLLNRFQLDAVLSF